MAIASITAWLTSPDKSYSHGRALYEQYGEDRITLAMIRSGSSTFHFNKLLAGLQKLNLHTDIAPKPIVIGQYKPEPVAVPGSKADIDFKDAPEKILQIKTEKSQRYAQARKLHEAIRIMDSKQHRLSAALELLDHMDFVSDAWSIIDEWREKGNIREMVQKEQCSSVADLTHAELLKEQSLLGPNITKDKARLAECKVPRKAVKIAARLQGREIRMEHIRRRLRELV
jgi:hypothetical protein